MAMRWDVFSMNLSVDVRDCAWTDDGSSRTSHFWRSRDGGILANIVFYSHFLATAKFNGRTFPRLFRLVIFFSEPKYGGRRLEPNSRLWIAKNVGPKDGVISINRRYEELDVKFSRKKVRGNITFVLNLDGRIGR